MKYNEISHFNHPQHKLRFEYSEFPFKCDGCNEVGIGSRYKCSSSNNTSTTTSYCDYDLHTQCAIPSQTLYHPFYKKCSFQFMSHPPGGAAARYCNACEKDVTGFVYHCKACGFDLHPCCAKLPMVLVLDDNNNGGSSGEVKLYLYRKASSSCHRCGRKGRSWSYRSSCKNYNLHVACVREMLVENWHELYYVGRGGGGRGGSRMSVVGLKNVLYSAHNNGSKGEKKKKKVKKCCEIAGLAVQFVISAVLGDPTAIIAGIVGSLISRA